MKPNGLETRWKFLLDSVSAWEAMLVEIENAKSTIKFEQFILQIDSIGARFLAALRKKAREGVKVEVLLDAAGSVGLFTASLLNDESEPNFSITFFNSLIPWSVGSHTTWFFRDHRKLIIIDSRIAYTGGVCLGDEMKNWRDTHVAIEGPIVKEMEWHFDRMWRRAKKMPQRSEKNAPKSPGGFNYVTSTPLPRRRFLYYLLVDAMRSAKKYMYITTPYFVPDRRIFRIIKLAAQRKVEIRLLLPYASDHPLVDFASKSFFTVLLKSGVRIYRYKGRMIHSKTIVIDGDWAAVGSLNFDNVSLRYNFEANIVSTNRQFAEDLRAQFTVDLHQTEEVVREEWEQRRLPAKILEIAGRILSPLL